MFLDCFEPILHDETFEDDYLDAGPGTAVEDCSEAANKLDFQNKQATNCSGKKGAKRDRIQKRGSRTKYDKKAKNSESYLPSKTNT